MNSERQNPCMESYSAANALWAIKACMWTAGSGWHFDWDILSLITCKFYCSNTSWARIIYFFPLFSAPPVNDAWCYLLHYCMYLHSESVAGISIVPHHMSWRDGNPCAIKSHQLMCTLYICSLFIVPHYTVYWAHWIFFISHSHSVKTASVWLIFIASGH